LSSGARDALVLAAFAALLLLPGLGRMGAYDSTDARYLAIARAMATSGDWLVPRLGGAPHLDKPPLAYWSGALGLRRADRSEAAGRFGQQLFTAAAALAVLGAARRWAGPAWGLPAGLALLTATLPFATSRGLATDWFLLAFTTAALIALYQAAQRRSAAAAAAAGVALGLSMLAKGPIGALVVAAVWGAFALVARRGRARLPGRGVALGLALFATIGLPWYALVVARMPGLLGWLLEFQLASRVTGSGAGHVKPLPWLLGVWAVGLLPWTPLAWLALARLWRRRREDAAAALAIAWALAPVVLFSLFATKLAGYVLPAFPGAALAIAIAGSRGLLDDRAARSRDRRGLRGDGGGGDRGRCAARRRGGAAGRLAAGGARRSIPRRAQRVRRRPAGDGRRCDRERSARAAPRRGARLRGARRRHGHRVRAHLRGDRARAPDAARRDGDRAPRAGRAPRRALAEARPLLLSRARGARLHRGRARARAALRRSRGGAAPRAPRARMPSRC
jgi:hypothetical protein